MRENTAGPRVAHFTLVPEPFPSFSRASGLLHQQGPYCKLTDTSGGRQALREEGQDREEEGKDDLSHASVLFANTFFKKGRAFRGERVSSY